MSGPSSSHWRIWPRPATVCSARSVAPLATCWPTKVSRALTVASPPTTTISAARPRGTRDPGQQVDGRHGQRGHQQRHHDGQHDHGEVADGPGDHRAGGHDDQEAPGPGRGELDARRHRGTRVGVGAAGQLGRGQPAFALVAQLAPLLEEPVRQPLLLLDRAAAQGAASQPSTGGRRTRVGPGHRRVAGGVGSGHLLLVHSAQPMRRPGRGADAALALIRGRGRGPRRGRRRSRCRPRAAPGRRGPRGRCRRRWRGSSGPGARSATRRRRATPRG